jgi:hypothetical protein
VKRRHVFFGVVAAGLVLVGALLGRIDWVSVPADGTAYRAAPQPASRDGGPGEIGRDNATLPAADTTSPNTASVAAESDSATNAMAIDQHKVSSQPQMSPIAARKLVRQQERERHCRMALLQSRPQQVAFREQREWRWMPPERAEAERSAFAAAISRMQQDCVAPADDKAERERQRLADQSAMNAAKEAGDLYAQLLSLPRGPDGKTDYDALRALAYEAVLSLDPEAISRVGTAAALLRQHTPGFDLWAPENQVYPGDLWPLLACDLGLDCSAGSPILDQICMADGSGCGYDNLEAAIRDRTAPRQWTLLQQRRQELLARIVNGDIAGMFDPPPQRNGAGGG